MSRYRRDKTLGGTWFFTVVTHQRAPLLCREAFRLALRRSIRRTRALYPFKIDAWVLLPDHFHTIWTLPRGDHDYSLRMRLVKRFVTQSCKALLGDHVRASPSRRNKGEQMLWQRRFWEHRIRNEPDLRQHLDYVHFNPVKHNLASRVADWSYSTFHRLVEAGVYDREWGANDPPPGIDRLEAGES